MHAIYDVHVKLFIEVRCNNKYKGMEQWFKEVRKLLKYKDNFLRSKLQHKKRKGI